MTTLGQNPSQPEVAAACNLSLAQAPAIRGIRLGMKPDEWLKLFPGSEQDEKVKAMLDRPAAYPSYGYTNIPFYPVFSQNQFSYLPREKFSGVEYVKLNLFDHQIVGFSVVYSPYPNQSQSQPVWDSASQLIPIFSETFNLPKISAWKVEGPWATLQCEGFEMKLEARSSQAAVYLSSKSDFQQIIRQRAEADKQKGRAAFKP
jgi:hypothetical protein